MLDMKVFSRRMNMWYKVNRFTEFKIDIDLMTDCDGFNIVFTNPGGVYTGYFNKFDPIDMILNGTPVMNGKIDSVEYIVDDSSVIQVIGRDIAAPLIDNDAIPCTRNNIRPSKYIDEKCKLYGIPKTSLDTSVPVIRELIIGSGESEISVMNNILMEDQKRLWLIYDTFYMGEWNTKAEPSYTFTRGLMLPGSIPIEKIRLLDDGTDIKSEVRIYGSVNDGAEKVVGVAKNDYMIQQNIKRLRTIRSSNNDTSSKYAASALRNIQSDFMDGITLTLVVKTDDVNVILPNKTALVVDNELKINSVFFIKSVSYSRDIQNGSLTTIKMIPGDVTFNVLWNNQGSKDKGYITSQSTLSLAELLKTRK